MKSIVKILGGMLVIILVVLLGAKLYTANSDDEFSAVLDQLNPLVSEGTVYVKTTEPLSVNDFGTASYRQLAADENGKTRKISFNGLSELKKGHYLKLTNKGAHVETYEEVSIDEVPKQALAKID